MADGSGRGFRPDDATVPAESLAAWRIWRALDRRFLPYSGGFMEQPDGLMNDIILLDSLFQTFTDEAQERG